MEVGAAGQLLLDRALVPGGALGEAFFKTAYEGGAEGLAAALSATAYAAVAAGEGACSPLAAERNADDYLCGLLRETAFCAFGPEVPFAYLMGLETSVKNVRVVLAGKAAGLDADTIRERVRASYV